MYQPTYLHKLDPHYNYLTPLLAVCITDWASLALLIVLIVLSKSNYYVFFILLPFLIQHAFLLYSLFNPKSWKNEDFRPLTEYTLYGIAQLWSSAQETLLVTRWMVVRNIVFYVLVICWVRSLWLYGQVIGVSYGLGTSFAGKSSCTAAYLDEGGVYNPFGVFSKPNVFSWDRSYVQCVFDDVRWANPSPLPKHRVSGYLKVSPGNNLDCSNPLNSGLVSISSCPLAEAYPDPTLGVTTPVVTGTTTASVDYCPGNANNEVVCYDPTNSFLIPCTTASPEISRVPGKPYKLCPACLNYVRGTSNFRFIDEGFDQCAGYDPSVPWDWFCIWCPGMGTGWLADEVASTDAVVTNFWLCTIPVLILYPLQYLLYWGLCYKKFVYKD